MVAGVMLLSYTAVSCTNDYFLDENNCWLYVPEIQKGSIPDFTAVFLPSIFTSLIISDHSF